MGARIVHKAELVGRNRDVEAAGRALHDTGGVVLAGEAGVGKTSVARTALAGLSVEDDIEILWLVASGSEPSIPFGVFAPFVPDIGGAPGRQPDPFFLLQTLRRAVLERAAGKPLVIGVDDAHCLDGPSAVLVYQMVAAREARVVLTARTGAGGPAAIRSLWKEELIERIDLEPLGRADTIGYARALLRGGELAGELDEALWRTSAGNPLYLRELVLAGRRSGHIADCDGLWRLRGDLSVGPRLSELVRERLDAVGADELASLEVLAFAGPLPFSVADRLLPAAHLAGLQRSGLLAVERSRRERVVRVAHPLFAELLRDAIPARRAAELAALLADGLEADGRLGEELLKVVAWRLDAGRAVPAGMLLEAGVSAGARQDWCLSERLAEAAVQAGGGVEASLALADARRALGRFAPALAALGGTTGCDDDQAARGAVLRAVVLGPGTGRFAEADAVLARTAEAIADPSAAAWVEAARAGLMVFAGRPAEAVDRSRALLERPGLGPRARLLARVTCALGLAWCARPDEALALLDPTEDPGDPGGTTKPGGPEPVAGWLPSSWSKLARMVAYAVTGRVADMEAMAADDYRLAVQLGNRQLMERAAGELGWVALLEGDLASAVSRFREATTDAGDPDTPGTRARSLIGLAEALAETGDLAGAAAALDAARPGAETTGAGPRWEIAAARLEAAEGSIGAALRRLDRAGRQARDRSLAVYELMALHASVRLGSATASRRLGELEAAAANPLVSTMAAHARALAADPGSGDRLDEVAEEYARLQLRLFAAEAAAQACQAHRRAGEPRRATASASRAYFLLGAPAGRPPLALSVATVPPELTRREGEVAALAARGISSSAIAERLCLSVRTVDTHLARVYFKLGIGSRSELARALAVEPAPGRQVEAG